MVTMRIGRAEERPHRHAGGPHGESWRFDFCAADGSVAGWVRHTLRGDRPRRYEAFLAGEHRQLLMVVDDDVPERSSPMEVRTTGLWADHMLETPLEHWTIGLEAFAVGLDDPLDAYGAARGDLVAYGLDLEFEASGPALAVPAPPAVSAYEIPVQVHGEILVGNDAIDFAGVGWRSHEWGEVDWMGDDGWHLTGTGDGDRRWRVDRRGSALDGQLVEGNGRVVAFSPEGEVSVDEAGLPTHGWFESEVLATEFSAIGVTPTVFVDGDRRAPRPAALVRYRIAAGGIGIGWLEWRGASAALDALRSS